MATDRPIAPRRRARGFTLLELLLAIVVVGTTLLLCAQALSSGISSAGESINVRAARELCRAKLEAVATGTESSTGGAVEEREGFSWAVVREDRTIGAGETPAEKYQVITVSVTYPSEIAPVDQDQQRGTGTVKLSTIVAPPELAKDKKK